MKNVKWLINRLKSMSIREVNWRVQQKFLMVKEKKYIYSKHLSVIDYPLNHNYEKLKLSISRLPIHWDNKIFDIFTNLDLFNIFPYNKYKKQWNAGFQTNNIWPKDEYSYKIQISQREDIGDIRTNWELNRHFQFSALAKNYFLTNDEKYLTELKDLFYDWNFNNLFLHGVQWTSVMEIAIRVNSWIYMYAFLEKSFQLNEGRRDKELLNKISNGILIMTDYIVEHRARFSSANNHLIIEMYAVGIAGIFYDYKPWKDLAINILTEELSKQNYVDGVNKEMSLHYQSFVMEAYGLLMVVMKHNNISIPKMWYEYLSNMSRFVCDCCGDYGETIVFGDNDEGKILDLFGRGFDYYRYSLDFMSCLLEKRYTELDCMHENLYWLFGVDAIEKSKQKEKYIPELVCSYSEGGYTILRSKDRRILIGIDHAELGFGSIAAHGHADALSFQLFLNGTPVFVDPGTYNYHITKQDRDEFRLTKNHNTVCIDNKNQSEILGPFLWGMRCLCQLKSIDINKESVSVIAEAKYNNIEHVRVWNFDFEKTLKIKDTFIDGENRQKIQIFNINPLINIIEGNERKKFLIYNQNTIQIVPNNNSVIREKKFMYSQKYNLKEYGKSLFVENRNDLEVEIKIL
ncbi:alginate lyase family protein [Clostridium perfringens]|uniref:alginate lyase family protein n=1 Tax=Clostridium perfringens TaxID=1502 RepID=UPI001CCC42B8|nr:alginate lyase family protein [Clostridium perfringens]UBK35292.1 heparinase II/III family protein [Clostridium perfringens]